MKKIYLIIILLNIISQGLVAHEPTNGDIYNVKKRMEAIITKQVDSFVNLVKNDFVLHYNSAGNQMKTNQVSIEELVLEKTEVVRDSSSGWFSGLSSYFGNKVHVTYKASDLIKLRIYKGLYEGIDGILGNSANVRNLMKEMEDDSVVIHEFIRRRKLSLDNEMSTMKYDPRNANSDFDYLMSSVSAGLKERIQQKLKE